LHLQVRYRARRANARRSCECAFVQRRWGVVQRKNVSWTRSGWCKPAVGRERTRFTSRKRTSAAKAVHTIKSGWREPAVVRERTGPVKDAHYCKCDTEPRRADARRSCECAFVQCRWGVVQRKNVSWTRSGWRKPAVVRERTRFTSRKRTSAARAVHTIKSGWRKPAVGRERAQLRKNACICKCDTEPRRADARRSWSDVRTSPNNAQLLTARRSHHTPRRADARRSCECAFVQRRWGVVQRTNVSWTRSGWRKPAVVRERTRFTSRKRTSAARAVHTIKSGWREPAVGRGRAQLRKTLASASALPCHGGLTPAALGRMCGRRRTVRDVDRTTFAPHTTAG
jgi:hypothetical protein